MPQPKRQSLRSIIKEDNSQAKDAPAPRPAAKATKKQRPRTAAAKAHLDDSGPKIGFPKSDFIKMTVTVPPDMHEELLDASRRRRRERKDYSVSAIVREALAEWLKRAS